MGLYGKHGTAYNLKVQSGDSWESLAKRAGLNERQFEDLMRANPNIMQLKAGQTVNTGGMRRNDNAYVSDYTAAAQGMATSGQLRDAYAANGTGGVSRPGQSSWIKPGEAVAGGNYGYNLATKGGQSQLAWQNSASNPNAAAFKPAVTTPAPIAGTVASGLAPVGYGNNAQVAPGVGTAEQNRPSVFGQQAAAQWMSQQDAQNKTHVQQQARQQAIIDHFRGAAQGAAFAASPQQLPATIGVLSPYEQLSGRNNTSTKINGPVSFTPENPSTQPSAPYVHPGSGYSNTNPLAAQDAVNAQNIQFQQQQVKVQSMDMALAIKNKLPPPNIPTANQQFMAQERGLSLAQWQANMIHDYGYQPGPNGTLVMPGNMTANGGPNLTPSASGDYSGLPAYQPPPTYYNSTAGYGYGGGGGGGGGGRQQQPYVRPSYQGISQQSGTWRIGG